MLLTPVTDILEIKLAADVVTNQLSYYISYIENGIMKSKYGLTNNKSNIQLLPAFTTPITVTSILVTNLDTASANVTLQLNNKQMTPGGTRTVILKKLLAPGEIIQYDGNSFEFPSSSSGGGCIINNYAGTPSATKQDYITGEDVTAGQAVMVDSDGFLYIMDITDSTHFGKCIGVAEQSALTGVACTVIMSGYCSVIGSTWIAGDSYYIHTTGFLINTSPVVGWSQQIGNGVDTDIISVDLGTGIEII